MREFFDIIIVGGGPAGLTAAIYARRAGKSVLVLEKESFGGQIASAPKVENFPGFSAISGAELADRLFSQAEALGAGGGDGDHRRCGQDRHHRLRRL